MRAYSKSPHPLGVTIIHCLMIFSSYHSYAQLAGDMKTDVLAGLRQSSLYNEETSGKKKKEGFWMIHWNVGYFMFEKDKGEFAVDFPYRSKDVSTGVITQQDYQSSHQDPFGKSTFLIDVISMAYSTSRNFYTGGFGFVANYDARYFNFCYGYNFFV